MNILTNGCSFSCMDLPHGKKGWATFSDFLPGVVSHIGYPGSGIEFVRTDKFLRRNKNVKLTHYIYQIPSPSRQPIDWDENEHFNNKCKCKICCKGFKSSGSINQFLKRHDLAPTDELISLFEKKTALYNIVLNILSRKINMLRERCPEIKLIFFRYEDTRWPVMYEFTKNFYKKTLVDFCKKNNITYIYNNNFHTNWFYKNNFTADNRHPNKAGAKLIAEIIQPYL